MKRYLLFGLVFMLLFLSGCTSQTYIHKVKDDGGAVIEKHIDLEGVRAYLSKSAQGRETLAELENNLSSVCAIVDGSYRDIECSIDERELVLTREFKPGNSYYRFSKSGGILFNKYSLTVVKIPEDEFNGALNRIIAEISGVEQLKIRENAINLNDKNASKELGNAYSASEGFGIYYVVEMPGRITNARAGSASAEVNGNSARFNLLEVMEDSEPLVVESEELNTDLIFLVVGALVLVALWYYFFKKR